MKSYYLIYSTFILLFVNIYFWIKKTNNDIENVLSILLFINFALSLLFWINPIKNSLIHKLDSFFIRFSIFFFSIYILFYKNFSVKKKILYLDAVALAMIIFYFSNFHSSIEWCSNNHILYHFLFHICGNICTIFAFI